MRNMKASSVLCDSPVKSVEKRSNKDCFYSNGLI